jgi:hypothetical protein
MKALCIALSLAALVVTTACPAADLDQSRLYNLKALKYLKSKSYDDAIREFQRAFYSAPSSKPLINIAKVYDEILQRKDLAMDYYKMAIEHAETDRERDELSVTVARLKGELLQKLTLLQVRSPGVAADVTLKTAETGSLVHQCLSPCDLWVDNGAYILVATKKGYHYVERPVTVVAKGVMLVTVDLEATSDRGVISVSTNVEGAVVTIDGENVGVTPYRGSFPPGRLAVRLEKPGFGAWSTEVELAPAETQSVHVFLKSGDELLMEGAGPLPAVAPLRSTCPPSTCPPAAATTAAAEPCPACPPAAPCATAGVDGTCPPPQIVEKVVERVVEKEVGGGRGAVPRWLKWVFLGAGTGLTGGGVGLQLVGKQKMDEANSLADTTPNYEKRFFDLRDQGALFTNQAYLGYGLGGACLVTGTVLWILEALEKPARKTTTLESPYAPSEAVTSPVPAAPGGVQP